MTPRSNPTTAFAVPLLARRHALRRSTLLAAWLLVALLAGPSAVAAPPAWSPQHAAEIEAAYLLNFARYTDWPADAFAGPAAPMVIAVIGPAWLAWTVRAVAEAADPIDGRNIRVVHWRRPPDARRLRQRRGALHVVFVDASADPPRGWLTMLAGQPVLTVGNGDRFVERGGMLGLIRTDQRILFSANPAAVQAAGLTVSAKVLKLAHSIAEPR